MSNILSTFMRDDHRACDTKFADMENAVANNNWSKGKKLFEKFASDLLHHFDMESFIHGMTFLVGFIKNIMFILYLIKI